MIESLSRYNALMSYRYLAYTTALKNLLAQLKNFGLLFALVLGPAVLGIALLLFLGLGKIVDSHEHARFSAQLALLYLALQAVMLWAVAPAITNSENRAFQAHIFKPAWLILIDCKLLLLSNVWLMASSLIAIDLRLQQWLQVPHFILFMLLQWLCGLMVIYRPYSLFYVFLACSILVLLPFSLDSLHYHSGFLIGFMGSLFFPNMNLSHKRVVSSLTSFWISYFLEHSWSVIWRSALFTASLLAAVQLVEIRSDFNHAIQVMVLANCVLLGSSLQFDCFAVLQKYRMFFQTNGQYRRFYLSHFIPSLLFYGAATLAAMLLLNVLQWPLVALAAVWCFLQQLLAQKKPAHYALVWCVITIGIALIA